MDAIERARRYFAKFPPAIEDSGGSNVALEAACVLTHGFCLSAADAMRFLQEWNRTCIPPWSQKELDHKLESALARTDHKKPRGHMLNNNWEGNGNGHQRPYRQAPEPEPALKAVTYQVEGWKLPPPLPDPTRRWMRALFRADDHIFIASFKKAEDGTDKLSGSANARDKWIEILNRKDGDATRTWRRENDPGIYVCVNPIRPGGARKKEDIAEYRYGLLEFDEGSLEEQYAVIEQSGIPCASVTYSGGKSIHALVKIMAKTEEEYAERMGMVHGHFAKYKPDKKTRDPTRLSRLPGCTRMDKCQDLLALNKGLATWGEWESKVFPRLSARPIGSLTAPQADDRNELLRHRYLCRGGGLLLVGQSGQGKSSLAMQMGILWSLGQPCFDIKPTRPLRILIVQAENDDGDMFEMFDGITKGLQLNPEEIGTAGNGILLFNEDSKGGEEFCRDVISPLVEQHKPDLIIIDPALAYVEGDTKDAEAVGRFLRKWLNPILHQHGCAAVIIHHTTKQKADGPQTTHDFLYAGAGSIEWTNWARAVLALETMGNGCYRLHAPKRGSRIRWRDKSDNPIFDRYIRHTRQRGQIFWQDVPEEEVASVRTETKSPTDLLAHVPAEGAILQTMLIENARASKITEKKARAFLAQLLLEKTVHLWLVKRKGTNALKLIGRHPQPEPAQSGDNGELPISPEVASVASEPPGKPSL